MVSNNDHLQNINAPFQGADCGDVVVVDPSGNVWESQWPSNDNCGEDNPGGCLAGAIGRFEPEDAIGNGTCTVTFPTAPAYFHIFNAHIRADSASMPNRWSVCAANTNFEGTDPFRYLVYFNEWDGYNASDVQWDCDSSSEYEYAIYGQSLNLEGY